MPGEFSGSSGTDKDAYSDSALQVLGSSKRIKTKALGSIKKETATSYLFAGDNTIQTTQGRWMLRKATV